MSKDISEYNDLGSAWDSDVEKIIGNSTEQIKILTQKQKFNLNASLYFKPIEELMKLYEGKRWFEGLVLACAYFQNIGLIKIREYAKINDDLFFGSKKIKKMRLHLDEVLVFLHTIGIIDKKQYSMMDEIREERNDLVHDPEHLEFFEKNPDYSKKLFQNAIRCLEKLRKINIEKFMKEH